MFAFHNSTEILENVKMKCVASHAQYVLMASTHITILGTLYIEAQTQPPHATGFNATNVYNTYIETRLCAWVCGVRCADPTALRMECFCTHRRMFMYSHSIGIRLLVLRFVYTESAAIASMKFTAFYDDDGD